MPYSHHSHSGQFCKHASGSLEDVVLEAIRQGFELYGLTEHVPRYRTQDLYPEEVMHKNSHYTPFINIFLKEGISLDILIQQFDDFLDEAHRLKALYASQINLLVGLETEVIASTDLDYLDALLQKNRGRVEYLVGSVHHVNGIPIDFDLPTFEKALRSVSNADTSEHERQQKFLSAYLDSQFELLHRFHPEIIGHLDLCRLYTPELRFSDYPLAWKKLERNILFAIEYGALFEVNAAAFRKKWESAYPALDVLEVCCLTMSCVHSFKRVYL